MFHQQRANHTFTSNNILAMNGEVNEVALISEELSRAVELTLNPIVSQEARSQAYNACESFKENSPWCAQAGLLLASGQYSAVVKHFGLQLMEHTVKYRWTQISQEEKIFIKENAMKLLIMGGWEVGHLNDALARVIVEMIKREWPQQWPTLLAELSDACARGHVHTQIVLHVFLRLVEDVATLQTLEQHQRRKDIYQALTSNMAEIFAFFMRLIELHVQEFREKTAAGDFNGAASNERVVQVVLLTLTGFVEWVSTNHVVTNNGRLLQILCILLQDDAFRLPAAECLLQVVNRKGSTKERKPLLILFSEDAISCIHRAAVTAINVVDDKNYLFLKKLSQVLVGLSQQVTSLWSFTTNVDVWMPIFVETLLVLSAHASLSIAHSVNSVWLCFFKHEHISKLPHLLAVVPRWLQTAAPKVLKVSYPSSRNITNTNDAVSFACIDYDSEHEFSTFFSRCRTEILESFRYCMTTAPLVTWSYVEQWTVSALDKVHSCGEDIDTSHPVYVEWEALSMVLDVVLSKLLSCEPRPDVSQGLQLLSRCVCTEPKSPLLLSLLLSFMSALFVFLSCAYSQLAGPTVGNAGAELLPRVLDKIFSSLVYEGKKVDDRKCRNVKNVRRHAASLLVKLGSKYPLLLLGVLGRIHMWARAALRERGLSSLEAVALQEALLLVANHLCCYEKQSAIIAEILSECTTHWPELSQVTSSVRSFVLGVGLHSCDMDAQPALGVRQQLLHYTALLLGVVKRSCVPDDPDKASRGGFSAGVSPSGNPLWRNPCSALVLPLLPHVLSLTLALHQLSTPSHVSLRHCSHAKALLMPLAEQLTLLGRRNMDSQAHSPQDKMQTFIHTLHDNVCHLIGSAASSLGRELYSVPGLASALSNSLLHSLPYLPDHWLKQIVRSALKPLLHHCVPSHLNDVAVPLMEVFAPFMLNHLNRRWEYISSLYESGKLEEEGSTESQEVLEDMIVRNLTREHVEVLKICLVGGPLNLESSSGDMEEDSSPPQRTVEQISELGNLLLNNTVTGPAVFQTLLVCVCCSDSVSSLRACVVLSALVRGVGVGSIPWFDSSCACDALLFTLRGLTAHGQHDANQAGLLHAAVQIYEVLRPQYPAMLSVLRAIPDVDAHDLNRLDEKVCNNANKPSKVDKAKRDLFKKITAKLIGRNVGQLFKKEVLIRDLPTMNVTPKDKPRSAMDTPEGANLDKLFSNGPNS